MSTTQEIKPTELEDWCLSLLHEGEREPMSESISEMFLKLMLINDDGIKAVHEKMMKQWSYKAIVKRVKVSLTVKIDKKVLIFICFLTEGTIGLMVLYVYYLQYWAFKNDVKKIDFSILAERIFPNGFFTQTNLERAWELQKTSRGNLIDFAPASKSIQFN